MSFDPENVERKHIIWNYSENTQAEKIVRASDYDQLLALYNGDYGESVYPVYGSVRKNIEAGMAIGAEHARGIVAQVQAKFDEASKRLLDEFEERYAQINGKKSPANDEIKGEPI